MRRICVFTATRAEYGLLRPLMSGLRESAAVELLTLVSGTHLCPEFGMTSEEIEADGFKIDERAEVVVSADTGTGMCLSAGLALVQYGRALERLRPDMLVVLGDRYETLAAVAAASLLRLPVAHIHGGEATEGAFDDAFRHAITKMSLLHFTATESYRRRVIQMGEHPARVVATGALGLADLRCTPLMNLEELAQSIDFRETAPYFIVTFHPVTTEHGSAKSQLGELLAALDEFPGHRVLLTKANADAEGRVVNSLLQQYADQRRDRCRLVASLGHRRYLSAVRYADAVVGNSSSGIIEVPSMNVPTVNIGDRQRGRIRASSVVDCPPNRGAIVGAIQRVTNPQWRAGISWDNPYERPGTVDKILTVLETADLNPERLKKSFYDLPSAQCLHDGDSPVGPNE